MKRVSTIPLLLLALMFVSCNEKVSPALEEGNSSTDPDPDPTIPVPPEEYYFRVVNTSPESLNYKLHKTGNGKRNVECKVASSGQPFDPDNFGITGVSEAVDNDITCFFEAEELALHHQGMKFKYEASPNTCEFIGYTPFSFYDRIPGDSSGSYLQVTCANETTTSTHVGTAATERTLDITTSGTDLGCGQWASQDIGSGARVSFVPEKDADLCRFNYTDEDKEQCDIGTITVNELVVTYTPPGEVPASQPAILKHEMKTRKIECGGKVSSCVNGAVKLKDPDRIRTTWITEAVINQVVKGEETLKATIGDFGTNKRYVNYRRALASPYIDYGSAAFDPDAFNNLIIGDPLAKLYTPLLVDLYSSNLRYNGTEILDAAAVDAVSYPENKYKAVPIAAEPFLGLTHKGTSYRTSPFYTFYCFDNAFDIKARIRMVVREWDRLYPNDANLELLSDIFMGASGRQDNNYIQPVPGGDVSEYIPFNDLPDWDDKIPMARTDGIFDPTTTVWEPSSGWFNPAVFTNNSF